MSNEEVRYGQAAEVLDELYDRALNRFTDQSAFDPRDYLSDDERTLFEEAQALELECLLNGPKQLGKRVVVEVLGGVAEVTSKPGNVEVEIIDHDNEAIA
jgi:hypothetical protein